MRVLVFGAGAIGSFLGHRLATAGHEVALIGRPAFVRAVQAHGLTLEKSDVRSAHVSAPYTTVHPASAERLSDLPVDQRHWDLILLTVKVYDTHDAAQALGALLAPQTPVLVVQNGVGGEELARAALPEAPLISGVLTLSVSVLDPGHVRLETSGGGLSLAPTRAARDIGPWATLFAAAGLRMATYADYRAMKWTKLLLNIQANAIPAILDMAPGDVYSHPALFGLERAAFREALAVMRALHLQVVSFPNYPVPLLAWAMRAWPSALLRPLLTRLVASGRGDKKPSLHLDLEGGRQRSEALYLNGAVVSHAERLGVPAPVNRVLLDTLLGITAGRIPWGAFRAQPDKLLAAIRHCDTGYRIRDAG